MARLFRVYVSGFPFEYVEYEAETREQAKAKNCEAMIEANYATNFKDALRYITGVRLAPKQADPPKGDET